MGMLLEQSLKCISVATVYETVVLNFIFFLEFSRAKNIRNFTYGKRYPEISEDGVMENVLLFSQEAR